MAAGRPVVLVIDGAIRDVVEAGECGVLAQLSDPPALAEDIHTLAAGPGRSRKMGLAGWKYL
jgi:glycosyltransferase involved in cell wall biosynthesis